MCSARLLPGHCYSPNLRRNSHTQTHALVGKMKSINTLLHYVTDGWLALGGTPPWTVPRARSTWKRKSRPGQGSLAHKLQHGFWLLFAPAATVTLQKKHTCGEGEISFCIMLVPSLLVPFYRVCNCFRFLSLVTPFCCCFESWIPLLG